MNNLILPLTKIVNSYLTCAYSHLDGLNEDQQIDIIIYDPELVVPHINLFEKWSLFRLNVIYGNLDNMKWLSAHKYPYFGSMPALAALNGNLDNMKWLLQNNFSFCEFTMPYAICNGNLDNIKWLIENGCPLLSHSAYNPLS